jgi:hypothetical protein
MVLKGPAPSLEETIMPQNPSKYFSMPPAPTLENLQKSFAKLNTQI